MSHNENTGLDVGQLASLWAAYTDTVVSLQHSVIANTVTGADCINSATAALDVGFNLIEDGSCLVEFSSQSGDPEVVTNTASLNDALVCFNGATSETVTINLTADITTSEGITTISNQSGGQLMLLGNGHTLRGDGTGRLLTISDTHASIQGLTLTHGDASGEDIKQGGAIYVTGGAVFTLRDSVVMSNTANAGGGISAVDESSTSIINSEILGNDGRNGGGARIFGHGVTPIA